MEIWEPKRTGNLWATPGLLRDCFTFYLIRTVVNSYKTTNFAAANEFYNIR